MGKIKTLKQYENAMKDLQAAGGIGAKKDERKKRVLEGETADYGQKLHAKETKGRPQPKAGH